MGNRDKNHSAYQKINNTFYQYVMIFMALCALSPIAHAAAPAKAKTAPTPISMKETQVDHSFLARMEGTSLVGYVPLPETTKSGVTIANGVDLGQMDMAEFNRLPINSALKAKLKPYVGLRKFEAVDFLKAHPLTINQEELKQLNAITAHKILIPLVKMYDQVSRVPFTKLPPEAQTALFSFAYQYGPGFMKLQGTPSELWNHYIRQDWKKVVKTLHSFNLYTYRRHQEAKLLAKL